MPMENCPNCGEDLAPNARVCPECGADEKTGWSDRAYSDRLGLPDDEFNYDKFVEEEFGENKEPRRVHPIWWLTAILLLGLFLFFLLRNSAGLRL